MRLAVWQVGGLPADEALLTRFPCKLAQTYSCGHNRLTPNIQMAFQCTLYLSSGHLGLHCVEKGKRLAQKVPHEALTKLQRRSPSGKGRAVGDNLLFVYGDDEQVRLKDIGPRDLDNFLALMEQLTPALLAS